VTRRKRCGGPVAAILPLIVLVFGLLSVPARTAGAPPDASGAREFLKGVEAYEEGRYGEAVELFSGLVRRGFRSGGLYYNLGNAYLKAGDLGRAVLWYERARRLTPDDADLRFNLEYARGLLRDEPPEAGFDPWRLLVFWNDLLGRRTVFWAAVVLNALFWLLFLPAPVRPAVPAWTRWLTAALTALFVAAALGGMLLDRVRSEAVVLPEEVVVRSAPSPGATELFRLHAGTLVRVDRVEQGGARIRYGRDRLGWVSAAEIGRIRAQDLP